ncbi:DNA adenine methylase [Variovorax sp. V77]|uniref:DNA adenine methylase n=1 Tax=Variovorax sp. V77 TaxID=3065959 RepID=UPI0034E851C2
MGSKRSMLLNGLGELLTDLVPKRRGFFDLFCGTGSVAGYVAQRFHTSVCAGDLQKYAVALAACQIEQTAVFSATEIGQDWIQAAKFWLDERRNLIDPALLLRPASEGLEDWRFAVLEARRLCVELPAEFSLARAYGGHYYSPHQAISLDALRATLPAQQRGAALAALIDAASTCAAAPGHTAQPFGISDSALPHLANAWSRDVSSSALSALSKIARLQANVPGRAVKSDALELTNELDEGDLAFIDPPYSEVQYSRFYHVLEAVAEGFAPEVSGVGRYPEIGLRPQSKFSLLTQSAQAFDDLMLGVAASGADAIVTFPSNEASNGLSGDLVEAISAQYFHVKTKKIASLFSTMGGNAISRHARQAQLSLFCTLLLGSDSQAPRRWQRNCIGSCARCEENDLEQPIAEYSMVNAARLP